MNISMQIAALSLIAFLQINPASAAIISYAGYAYDDSGNTVQGGGLEWLRWDETIGESINSAFATYAAAGWRLAGTTEMSTLFNAFNFGGVYDNLEGSTDNYQLPYTVGDALDPHTFFSSIFGITQVQPIGTSCTPGCTYTEELVLSLAFFGSDLNSNEIYETASVFGDYVLEQVGFIQQIGGRGILFEDSLPGSPDRFDTRSNGGIALVRTPATVPLPGTMALLLTGLLFLKKKRAVAGDSSFLA